MINLREENSFRSFSNPYLPEPRLDADAHPKDLQETNRIVVLGDKLAEIGARALSKDYEKQLDSALLGAKVIDYGVFGAIAGMQATVFAQHFFPISSKVTGPLSTVLKTLALPTSLFFIGFGLIEGFAEVIALKRSAVFLSCMDKQSQYPLKKIQWVVDKYFKLSSKQQQKIQKYIEQNHPSLSLEEKGAFYNKLANRALEIQFAALERRITPGLAKQVQLELPELIEAFRTSDPRKLDLAFERSNAIIGSLQRESKVKILVHVIALAAIATTLLSMSLMIGGIIAPVLFIILGATTALLTVISFLLSKGVVNTEAARLYDCLASKQRPLELVSKGAK